jgi:hypothetical protein
VADCRLAGLSGLGVQVPLGLEQLQGQRHPPHVRVRPRGEQVHQLPLVERGHHPAAHPDQRLVGLVEHAQRLVPPPALGQPQDVGQHLADLLDLAHQVIALVDGSLLG